MIWFWLYLAVGFGATMEWLLYRLAASRKAPIKGSALLYTLFVWPIGLVAVVAMLCSPSVTANLRRNLGAPPE